MKFRIEEYRRGTYRVWIKKWYTFWYSGYIYTSFFELNYSSFELAEKAINTYKNRFTIIKEPHETH